MQSLLHAFVILSTHGAASRFKNIPDVFHEAFSSLSPGYGDAHMMADRFAGTSRHINNLDTEMTTMTHSKRFSLAAAVLLMAGLFTAAAAQRETTTRTAVYTIQGDQVAKGEVPSAPNTLSVIYAGKVQGRTSTRSAQVKAFNLSLQYKVQGKTATVVGGQLSLTTVREGLEFVSGGAVQGGVTMSLKSDGTPAAGTYTFDFKGDDPELPSSGNFSLAVDGKKTKVGGSIVLNYTVPL